MHIWDLYLRKLSKKQKSVVLKTLFDARKCEPGAEDALPYGVPGLKLNDKNIIAVAAHKNHLGIYPFDPEIVTKIKSMFPNIETSKGTLRFGYDNLPSTELIKEIISLRKL